ncbi:MAG: hypothetical protein Q9159_002948 [Coniocarpon cinnabarinum]
MPDSDVGGDIEMAEYESCTVVYKHSLREISQSWAHTRSIGNAESKQSQESSNTYQTLPFTADRRSMAMEDRGESRCLLRMASILRPATTNSAARVRADEMLHGSWWVGPRLACGTAG